MRELMTTLLDATGLLLVSAGAGVAAGHWIGWSGIAVSGLMLLAGSWLVDKVGGGG